MALEAFSRRGWSCVYCTTHSFRLLFRLLYGDVRIRVNREVWGTVSPITSPRCLAHGIGPTVEHAIGQLVNDWGRVIRANSVEEMRVVPPPWVLES
jgi:hypothetical protein